MPSVLDRVIERQLRKELKDALLRFEQQLPARSRCGSGKAEMSSMISHAQDGRA